MRLFSTYPRIAFSVAVHESKEANIPDFLANLAALRWPRGRIRYYFVINNSGAEFAGKFRLMASRLPGHVGFIEPGRIEDVNRNPSPSISKVASIGAQAFQSGVIHALEAGADYIVFVSPDVMLPPRTLEYLEGAFKRFHDCGISCLTSYFRLDGVEGLAREAEARFGKAELKGAYNRALMMIPLEGEPGNNYFRHPYYRARAANGVMMASRLVMERISWRSELTGARYGPDFQLCEDARVIAGKATYCYTKEQSIHVSQDNKSWW